MNKPIQYTDEPIEGRIIDDFLPPPEKLKFRQSAVRVSYDSTRDILHMRLRPGLIERSVEVENGIVVNYDAEGRIVSLELLDASTQASNPKAIEFAVS